LITYIILYDYLLAVRLKIFSTTALTLPSILCNAIRCIPTIYILDMRIFSRKMEKVPKNNSRNMAIPSSSILSIIAGLLIVIGGFLIPLTMMLGMSGHYGMKMSGFGTGVMTRGSCQIYLDVLDLL
jgi:hypothetical protein